MTDTEHRRASSSNEEDEEIRWCLRDLISDCFMRYDILNPDTLVCFNNKITKIKILQKQWIQI